MESRGLTVGLDLPLSSNGEDGGEDEGEDEEEEEEEEMNGVGLRPRNLNNGIFELFAYLGRIIPQLFQNGKINENNV